MGIQKNSQAVSTLKSFVYGKGKNPKNSQTVSVLNSLTREKGDTKELKQLVLWNLLFKGKGRIQRILRLCPFEFFEKGEGRHKRIQAVSPCWILFGKERREWKDIVHFCFLQKNKVCKTENLESFSEKEEEEVQRDSRLVKDCLNELEKWEEIHKKNSCD